MRRGQTHGANLSHMSTVTVVFGARQHKSKVTPGTLLSQVLADACTALALGDASQYALLHGGAVKKPLDLATPFRLSGLANNVSQNIVGFGWLVAF